MFNERDVLITRTISLITRKGSDNIAAILHTPVLLEWLVRPKRDTQHHQMITHRTITQRPRNDHNDLKNKLKGLTTGDKENAVMQSIYD